MVKITPALEKRARIRSSTKVIEDKVSGSRYKVLSAEAFTKHGLKTSACVFDELHTQPNRALWDVMTFEAGSARFQPIWWVITTAGDDPDRVSIAWEQHEYAMSVLSGEIIDPTWYVVIYNYDGEDIYNEKNWFIANPSLGKAKSLESMREVAVKAKANPGTERLFRWLDLNQWITTKLTTWLPLDLWDATVGDWNRMDLLGLDCYLGMDLSSTTDLTSLCWLFPPQGRMLEWRAIWENFIPEANMVERIRNDKIQYDEFVKEKWLTATPGDVVDYTRVRDVILESRNLYNIKEVCLDRSFATMMVQELTQANMLCVDVPQTFVSLTSPMTMVEYLLRKAAPPRSTGGPLPALPVDGPLPTLPVDGEEDVCAQTSGADKSATTGNVDAGDLAKLGLKAHMMSKMTHEPNRTARWAFGNTSKATNGNAQIKYVKEHKGRGVDRTKRIDPTAAWVIAMARAMFYQGSVDLSERILSDDWGM